MSPCNKISSSAPEDFSGQTSSELHSLRLLSNDNDAPGYLPGNASKLRKLFKLPFELPPLQLQQDNYDAWGRKVKHLFYAAGWYDMYKASQQDEAKDNNATSWMRYQSWSVLAASLDTSMKAKVTAVKAGEVETLLREIERQIYKNARNSGKEPTCSQEQGTGQASQGDAGQQHQQNSALLCRGHMGNSQPQGGGQTPGMNFRGERWQLKQPVGPRCPEGARPGHEIHRTSMTSNGCGDHSTVAAASTTYQLSASKLQIKQQNHSANSRATATYQLFASKLHTKQQKRSTYSQTTEANLKANLHAQSLSTKKNATTRTKRKSQCNESELKHTFNNAQTVPAKKLLEINCMILQERNQAKIIPSMEKHNEISTAKIAKEPDLFFFSPVRQRDPMNSDAKLSANVIALQLFSANVITPKRQSGKYARNGPESRIVGSLPLSRNKSPSTGQNNNGNLPLKKDKSAYPDHEKREPCYVFCTSYHTARAYDPGISYLLQWHRGLWNQDFSTTINFLCIQLSTKQRFRQIYDDWKLGTCRHTMQHTHANSALKLELPNFAYLFMVGAAGLLQVLARGGGPYLAIFMNDHSDRSIVTIVATSSDFDTIFRDFNAKHKVQWIQDMMIAQPVADNRKDHSPNQFSLLGNRKGTLQLVPHPCNPSVNAAERSVTIGTEMSSMTSTQNVALFFGLSKLLRMQAIYVLERCVSDYANKHATPRQRSINHELQDALGAIRCFGCAPCSEHIPVVTFNSFDEQMDPVRTSVGKYAARLCHCLLSFPHYETSCPALGVFLQHASSYKSITYKVTTDLLGTIARLPASINRQIRPSAVHNGQISTENRISTFHEHFEPISASLSIPATVRIPSTADQQVGTAIEQLCTGPDDLHQTASSKRPDHAMAQPKPAARNFRRALIQRIKTHKAHKLLEPQVGPPYNKHILFLAAFTHAVKRDDFSSYQACLVISSCKQHIGADFSATPSTPNYVSDCTSLMTATEQQLWNLGVGLVYECSRA